MSTVIAKVTAIEIITEGEKKTTINTELEFTADQLESLEKRIDAILIALFPPKIYEQIEVVNTSVEITKIY